ncbi:MAG: BrxE family protein [Pseudomonadota bacterium]
MKESYLSTLLQMRLLVGFLGERAQFAWWPTAFFEPSSRLFLEPVFAKTSRLAQYHGVVEAARRLHDEHLNVGSYHLFRLPEEIEQDLHMMVQERDGESVASSALQGKDDALDTLKSLAGGSSSPAEGPIAIDSIGGLDSPSAIQAVAGAYLSAFMQNTRIYPYFASKS